MRTLDDVLAATRRLKEEMEKQGEVAAALVLCNALSDIFNTSTEALEVILEALDASSPTWKLHLDGRRRREVEQLVRDARAMMNLK